jgi:hypothetical protein
MGFLFSRDGSISAVRVGTLIAIFGLLLVIAAGISFFIDQGTRRVPLEIEPPPGAIAGGLIPIGAFRRERYYTLNGVEAGAVAVYYDEKLQAMEGGAASECLRFPRVGEFDGYERGNGLVPYEYRCIFDRSGFNTTQYTTVTIQPGIWDSDPEKNREGSVVVRYEQVWSP